MTVGHAHMAAMDSDPPPQAPMPDAIPPDAPVPDAQAPDAPVIVIFGAAVRPDGQPSRVLRHRIQAALRHGATLPGAIYLPTGGQGRFGPPEAMVMRDALLAGGVPAGRIRVEPTAGDTVASVRAVWRMLRGAGHRGPVLVATSAYHQPRCLLLCRLAGLAARLCPPPPESASRTLWRRWYWRLREVPALPYDAAIIAWLRLTGRM